MSFQFFYICIALFLIECSLCYDASTVDGGDCGDFFIIINKDYKSSQCAIHKCANGTMIDDFTYQTCVDCPKGYFCNNSKIKLFS